MIINCPPVIISPISSTDVCFRIDLADDLAFANDEQPVGKGGHLFEFRRNQQDSRAGIAQRDQLAMNELDRADIDAASRLRDEQ